MFKVQDLELPLIRTQHTQWALVQLLDPLITYYLLECSDECAQGDGSLSFNAYRSVSSSPPIAQYCNVAVVHFKIHTYFHLTAFRSGEHHYLPKSAVTLGQHDFNLSDRTSSFKV